MGRRDRGAANSTLCGIFPDGHVWFMISHLSHRTVCGEGHRDVSQARGCEGATDRGLVSLGRGRARQGKQQYAERRRIEPKSLEWELTTTLGRARMPQKPITGSGVQEDRHGAASLHEALLLGRIATADGDAFETLYHVYYPRLRRFLERVTRRPHLVEEILNDTMMVVWRKADAYNFGSKVSTWIFAIAYRKALKALRGIDDAVDFDPDENTAHLMPGPEGELQQKEVRAYLGRAMSALSAEQRAVIELTYYEGYAYREIADILGCPIDTVKTRMFHARRKLKALLARDRGEAI